MVVTGRGPGVEDEGAARDDGGRAIAFVGVVVGVLLALWLIKGIWTPGLPVGSDMGAHFVRAQLAMDDSALMRRDEGFRQFHLARVVLAVADQNDRLSSSLLGKLFFAGNDARSLRARRARH